MKKNKLTLPKVLIILLLVVLVSTSLLSRTLAKYITTDTLANDTVRVAKWGVKVEAEGDLFKDAYATDDDDYDEDSVISADSSLVVAPGTSGQTASVSITGKPEVATRIKLHDKGSQLTGWDYTGGYEPVKWTLSISGADPLVEGGSFEDLIDALEAENMEFEPNTDLSTESFDISWEWPFTGNDDGDTYYGDKETAPTIDFKFDITITQID